MLRIAAVEAASEYFTQMDALHGDPLGHVMIPETVRGTHSLPSSHQQVGRR